VRERLMRRKALTVPTVGKVGIWSLELRYGDRQAADRAERGGHWRDRAEALW